MGYNGKGRNSTKYIVIHCAATKPSMDIGAAEIRKWHTDPPRNWDDIGYHYVIRRSGTIEKPMLEVGRYLEIPGAHVANHNHESIGICLVGGMAEDGSPENNFTNDQMMVLHDLIKVCMIMYPDAEVVGHCDLDPENKADCPGFDVRQWFIEEFIGPHGG
jgi:N-acetyl-anhydromuramyl-L-alanine amidase AmpD